MYCLSLFICQPPTILTIFFVGETTESFYPAKPLTKLPMYYSGLSQLCNNVRLMCTVLTNTVKQKHNFFFILEITA